MIPLLLMLAATDAPSMTSIDAERAFAGDAKVDGQWTAFRKWSTADAVMFVPQPINAQAFLKDRKDPPVAMDWWPAASYVSCDGKTAVNTGGWRRPDGTVGYFTTVWQRQADGGWKWLVDGGDTLKVARERPAEPKVVRASCKRAGGLHVASGLRSLDAKREVGASADNTLSWQWDVMPDGARTFVVWIDDDGDREQLSPVIDDSIPAPPK